MSFVDPISLHGQRVSLVPLSPSHHDDLAAAVKDGELWKLWYTKFPRPINCGRKSAGAWNFRSRAR